jgi:hypothetical protein
VSQSLPFGKHKGRPIDEVPVDYLQWMAGQKLQPGTRQMIAESLGRRGSTVPHQPAARQTHTRQAGRPAARPAAKPDYAYALIPCPGCGTVLRVAVTEDRA